MSPQERAAYRAWKHANAEADWAMSAVERVLWLAVGGLTMVLAVVVAEAMR
jgi:hypothetical protein